MSENGHNALYFRTDGVGDSDGYKFGFFFPSDLGDSDRYIIRLKEGLTFWYFSFAMCLKHMFRYIANEDRGKATKLWSAC